jgi:GntR family transcriptional regulator/MocR family aminotransferase
LPSLRKLSQHLQLSKNTIEAAYEQLYAEGYVRRIPKVGYIVEDIRTDFLQVPPMPTSPAIMNEHSNDPKNLNYDFSPHYLDIESYNIKNWKNAVTSVINEDFSRLLSYGDPQGEQELRYEIVRHIYENRGVHCRPNQIFVGAGTQYCLNLLCQLFKKNFNRIAMEDPGSNYVRTIFESNQFAIEPIAVRSDGLDVDQLTSRNCRLAFVTPSHQFPKGVIMSVKNRVQLLQWAQSADGIILEDDYDSEMRFVGAPIPALKSLDKMDRVIYLGTFSKVFLPTLRISFIVLPEWLLPIFLNKYKTLQQTTSKLNQLALARFMEKGDLQSHIKRMRRHYETKYHIMTKALHSHMDDHVHVISNGAGMRVILELKTKLSEAALVKLAQAAGIKIVPISQYYIEKTGCAPNGNVMVLLSYKGIPAENIEPAIKALRSAWFGTLIK